MEFSLSEEQTLLRDSLDKYFLDNYDFRSRQNIVATGEGYSRSHWASYADLGWLSVPFDESLGGYGGQIEDTAILCEQMGRALALEPFLANVILVGPLLACSDKRHLVSSLIDGSAQFALAYAERNGRQDVFNVQTKARPEGQNYMLSGDKVLVLNGMTARYLVVTARTSGKSNDTSGITLFLVDCEKQNIHRQEISLMDGTRAANISLDNIVLSADDVLGQVGEANTMLERTVAEARIAITAEAIGIMDVLREKTLEYTKTREQFGVAISSFQALQHRLVEMFMATEQARSMLYRAICEYQQKDTRALSTIAATKAFVGEKGRLIGEEAIQIHGGMGMTDELDIGHYVKRLMMLHHLFGDADSTYREYFSSVNFAEGV